MRSGSPLWLVPGWGNTNTSVALWFWNVVVWGLILSVGKDIVAHYRWIILSTAFFFYALFGPVFVFELNAQFGFSKIGVVIDVVFSYFLLSKQSFSVFVYL